MDVFAISCHLFKCYFLTATGHWRMSENEMNKWKWNEWVKMKWISENEMNEWKMEFFAIILLHALVTCFYSLLAWLQLSGSGYSGKMGRGNVRNIIWLMSSIVYLRPAMEWSSIDFTENKYHTRCSYYFSCLILLILPPTPSRPRRSVVSNLHSSSTLTLTSASLPGAQVAPALSTINSASFYPHSGRSCIEHSG